MSRLFCLILFIVCQLTAMGQQQPASVKRSPKLHTGQWRVLLHRKDSVDIIFNFEVKDSLGEQVIYIRNAGERLFVDDIKWKADHGDSVVITLPFFESQIRAKLSKDGWLDGVWLKRLKDSYQSMDLFAVYNTAFRFPGGGPKVLDVTGRWAVSLGDPAVKTPEQMVGEFIQKGDQVTGTFLNPTGDYRYLEGEVGVWDSLKLSCFDGGHAYYFRAKIEKNNTLTGQFFSGNAPMQPWTALKDPNAKLPDEFSLTKWRKDAGTMDFSFPDLDGKTVSFSDDRFTNKIVLVQIMGSWCPNCMDETRFLSEFYDRYHSKGVEIVGLAYERSTDFTRSQKSLRAFQQRFGVKYPLLITGVTVDDPHKADKTLPQLDAIVGFPTTIFVDRQGRIAKIHTGFNGPGTGEHYEEQKKEFYEIVDGLLGE